jgi:exodeoxyribonuclease VII small subunit
MHLTLSGAQLARNKRTTAVALGHPRTAAKRSGRLQFAPYFTLAMVKSAHPRTAAVSDRPASDDTVAAERADPPLPASYEAALAELERLVGSMESAQLPLDQLLGAYQRGAQLLSFCRGRLEAVEQQVKKLEDGQLTPWSAEA